MVRAKCIYDAEILPDSLFNSSCIGKLYECINAIEYIVQAFKNTRNKVGVSRAEASIEERKKTK